jgi:hypothetical protein
MGRIVVIFLVGLATIALPSAQQSAGDPAVRKAYDELLDTNVRDGFVYSRALKSEHGRLDAYLNLIGAANVAALPRDAQVAFWLNAYNALVLKTVIDHYPIRGRSTENPAHSDRQIPGAYERLQHRVAGRMLTLDQIEQTVLPEFRDPRLYMALGRGAVGSGRLRSEAYVPARLEAQLTEAANECASRTECLQIDRAQNTVAVSAIFSWREKEFAGAYADAAPAAFTGRSPIERAVLAFVEPKLLTTEKEFLAKNDFRLTYQPFDWRLNDLTGRGGR